MGKTSSGTILLAFIAILCGLLGTYAFRKAMRPRAVAAAPVEPPMIVIPMASTDLPAGRQLTLGDIAIVRMTRKQMKDRNVHSPFMSNTDQIIGRTLKKELNRGDTFDTLYFYPEGLGPGVAERLQSGERAVTVSVANENGLIGFAGAGQLVDVLFHAGEIESYGSSDRGRWGRNSEFQRYLDEFGATSTLIQGVRVLALGTDTFAPVTPAGAVTRGDRLRVTLAVTPDQAEILRVVEGHGALSLTLRNPDDAATVNLDGRRTLRDVLGMPPQSNNEMEVYRGQRVDRVYFDRTSNISRRDGRQNYAADSAETPEEDLPILQAPTPQQVQALDDLAR